jgi:hypothetical protein
MQLRSASVRPGRGRAGEIQAQAVGRREPRALTDHDHHLFGPQGLADLVAQGHAGLAGDDHGQRTQVREIGLQGLQQGQAMTGRGQGRQAVGQHHRQPRPRRPQARPLRVQQGEAFRRQAAAAVGAAQIHAAVGGLAVDGQAGKPGVRQVGLQGGHIQGLMHGIAGLGMGGAKAQDFAGRQAHPRHGPGPPGRGSGPAGAARGRG